MRFRKQLPRWLRQAAQRKDEKAAPDGMNRAAFRAAGLQGRRGSRVVARKRTILSGLHEPVEPQWVGRRRGGFLTRGGRPRILVPYAMSRRRIEKLMRQVRVRTVTEEESVDA